MKATEFDKQFDAGDIVSDAIDRSQARRRTISPSVNVHFSAVVVDSLDKPARHLGVTRQSLIKLWIAERRTVSLIEARSNDDLYGRPWYEKWTMGRMIQFNTASPYANARGRVRKWLKTKSASRKS